MRWLKRNSVLLAILCIMVVLFWWVTGWPTAWDTLWTVVVVVACVAAMTTANAYLMPSTKRTDSQNQKGPPT